MATRKAQGKKVRSKREANVIPRSERVSRLGNSTVHWAAKPSTTTALGKHTVVRGAALEDYYNAGVLNPAGRKVTTIRKIDANSASFGADLEGVFRANVRKARRQNKRAVGMPDRGIGKG